MRKLLKIAAVFLFFFAGTPPAFAAQELPPMDDKSISMDLQNANLKDVLKIFSIQSGLNFIAAQNVEDRRITLFLDKVPIREGLNKLFEANNLTYDYDEAANIYLVKYWGEPQLELLTKIYHLKNRSVHSSTLEKEKVALMSQSGMGEGLRSTSGTGVNEDTTNSITEIIKQVISKDGKISEDKRTNSLIITDIPSRFPVIDELIARLDIPQPMVMLEVEILDVSRSMMDKIGAEFGSIDSPNPLTLSFNKGFSFNNIAASFGNTAPGASGSLSFGRAGDFNYSVMLDFIRQQSDVRFLARPKILTMNNETAEIGVTKDEVVSVKQTTSSTGAAGVATTTVEFDRATDLTLTPEGIGVFLRVTPQINMETGEITMVVNPKTSSATQSSLVPASGPNGEIQVALDPEVRMTKSIIKVKDGETVALGGLIHKENQTTVKKVPLLGDIPLIGLLFRHKTTDKDQDRELLVFITPRIMKDIGNKLAKADTDPAYALQYLSSGSKRTQAVESLLDVYEDK